MMVGGGRCVALNRVEEFSLAAEVTFLGLGCWD